MHNLQCDLPCAQVVRLLRQAVRSVHGHGAAPFTRLPSLVKDPEHPNVLYWSITELRFRSRVTKRPRLHRAAQSKPSGETEGHPIKNLH